jgi:hypothetical protein
MAQQLRGGVPTIDGDASALFDAPNFTGTPERRLLLAILERAILDYVGNDEKEVTEANDWLFTEDQGIFSFSWLCQELDLDEHIIAEKIRKMPRRGNRRVAPWYFQRAMEA